MRPLPLRLFIHFKQIIMATFKNGFFGKKTGKIGNLVFYERMGKEVVRIIGKSLKPPTEAQLACRQAISVTSGMLKPALAFLNIGFGPEGHKQQKLAYNLAMSYNRLNALKGTYPNMEVDYAQVLFAQGDLLEPQNATVSLAAGGLDFTWLTYPEMPWPTLTDQVMLLAFFPLKGRCVYSVFWEKRITGTARLDLSAPLVTEYMETYIAFISADRKKVSNTVYTGSFIK